MSVQEEELYDRFEAERGGGNIAPVVSWKKSDKGDSFTGILLPGDPIERPDKGYSLRREYKQANPKENQAAGFTVWPPKGNVEDIQRPVVESEFRKRWPDEDINQAKKVSQYHYTFETGLTDASLLSSQWKERCAEQDPPVDPKAETRRRVIEQGKSLTEQIDAALKQVGGKPIPGQTWTITLADQIPNEYGGETNLFKVVITRPTPETRALVAAYVEKERLAAAQAEDEKDPDDKYTGTGAAAEQEPPPF